MSGDALLVLFPLGPPCANNLKNYRIGVFLAHPWKVTTGVRLEQGLGLTDVPRGRPGRRPEDERGHAPDCYFIVYKINPSAPVLSLSSSRSDISGPVDR